MSRISPTKINLIKLKIDNKVATDGLDLLEQKKEILLLEIMKYVDRAKRIEREFNDLLEKGYNLLKEAFIRIERDRVIFDSLLAKTEIILNKRVRKIIGKHLPDFEMKTNEDKFENFISFHSSVEDKIKDKFIKIVNMLVDYAEVKRSIMILSSELKKTNRRVNALEKIIIPEQEKNIKFIESHLEEMEKEAIFVSKLIKKKKYQKSK